MMKSIKEKPLENQEKGDSFHRGRNFFFIFIGVLGLLFVFWYDCEPYYEWIHSYGGNTTASFAIYFILNIAISRYGRGRRATTLATLLISEIFEATNGFFGLMQNTYDPLDYAANAFGVALALGLDLLAAKLFDKLGDEKT